MIIQSRSNRPNFKNTVRRFLYKVAVLFFAVATFHFAQAKTKLEVVTTSGILESITAEIGKPHVKASSLTSKYSDLHGVLPHVSQQNSLMRADILITYGLGLESPWLPELLSSIKNPVVQPDTTTYIETGSAIEPLGKAGDGKRINPASNHLEGNPHFLLNPDNLKKVVDLIALRLERVAENHGMQPEQSRIFQINAQNLEKEINKKTVEWRRRLSQMKIPGVITYHSSLNYFLDYFEIPLIGTIETMPGVKPRPEHLTKLAKLSRDKHANCALIERTHASEVGNLKSFLKSAQIPFYLIDTELNTEVGNLKPGIRSYMSLMGQLVDVMEKCKSRSML